jgi:chaperone protein EcpD
MNARLVFKFLLMGGLAALALLGAVQANASVVISGTRIVYLQDDSEVTVKLSNVGQSPSLVQAWIDAGDASAPAAQIDAPFTITPPLSRVDPAKGQTLRIIYTGDPLPSDRESVFWLNVLEIPPKPTGDLADTNHIQLAFRSRIKLFYRPQGLKGSADAAPSQLVWQVVTTGGDASLQVTNPSAFNVSLTEVELIDGEKTAKFEDGAMVGPGQKLIVPLKGAVARSQTATVRFHSLNDYGGAVEGKSRLTPASATPDANTPIPAVSAEAASSPVQ